jgi:hypothetical protein
MAIHRKMTDEEAATIEASWGNTTEAFALFDLIDVEFRTDPMSTQCFDARIVERVKVCVANRKEYTAKAERFMPFVG